MSEFISEFKKNIFNITKSTFENEALRLFQYQSIHNKVYSDYIKNLSVDRKNIDCIENIPFLPVEFFKSHKVVSSNKEPESIFESSGTTGEETSKHYISDVDFYNQITKKGFEQFFGNLKEFVILGLLPSYLERNNSSLVYMVSEFIKKSANENSGFYLDDFKSLKLMLNKYTNKNQKVLLIGVSFALLDFGEVIDFTLTDNISIMETGGMKGRRKELLREELHNELKSRFIANTVYSEYGMTELLSQAYMLNDGFFHNPNWMKTLIRDADDPFSIRNEGKGVVNVIDLANVESCSFLALQDLGELNPDGTFQIIGRVDNSDIRGCNLMYFS